MWMVTVVVFSFSSWAIVTQLCPIGVSNTTSPNCFRN